MSINSKKVIEILGRIAEVMEENKQFLTDLDAAIGDGDHGINMSRGFHAVRDKLQDFKSSNIGEILKTAGMALVSNVGGAAGPLYGTAFMKAGMAVDGKEELSISDFVIMMKAALEGMKMRGKAELEDKTIIDAIEKALDALNHAIEKGLTPEQAMKEAVDAAYEGVEHTKDIIAKKGRSSYLAERSIGHQDPGATSCALILKTIYEEIKE